MKFYNKTSEIHFNKSSDEDKNFFKYLALKTIIMPYTT